MTTSETVVHHEPQPYTELCINENVQQSEPPFPLLLNPNSFLLSQVPGIYPDEIQYLHFSGDPKLNSLMISFLGYQRQFIHNFKILLEILRLLNGNSNFKLIPDNLLSLAQNLLHEHQDFLTKLEEILSNSSSIMIVAFIEALAHSVSMIDSHSKYIFQFLKIEQHIHNLCFVSNLSHLSQQIENLIQINQLKLYSKSSEIKTVNQAIENPETHQSTLVHDDYYNSLFVTNCDGIPLLIDYFKLPFQWQKTAAKTAKSILVLCPQDKLPDPQLIVSLSDFVNTLSNVESSIESFPKLIQISHMFFWGSFPIAVCGRRFIREGKAMKQCRKSLSERTLLLFSDIFVYVQLRGGKYLIPRVYRLSYLRIQSVTHPTNSSSLISLLTGLRDKSTIAEQSKGKPTIYLFAPRKSFILAFNSFEERDSWAKSLNEAIEASKVNLVIPKYTEAPIWFPDNLVTRCMRCKTQFSLLLRKHHCRCCGEILCKNCLQFRIILKNISLTSPVKVCQKCFNRLQEESKLKNSKKDDEEIMMENLVKTIPQAYVSSSDTSEEDKDDFDDALLVGCP